MNTTLENQGKISYVDLPYSSAAHHSWRVDDGIATPDGVLKVAGQRSVKNAKE